MPDLFYLLHRWWKEILGLTLAALAVATAVLFSLTPRYLGVATAIPASTYAADRASVFNQHIQALYSALGTPDDLDKVIGTARLDTVYLAVTDQLQLAQYYSPGGPEAERRGKAARELRKYSRVVKSEYGELKVKVWDKDRHMAPRLANALLQQLSDMHRDLQAYGNQHTLNGLLEMRAKWAGARDSLPVHSPEQAKEQAASLDKLITEYQLMVDHKPPSLIPVETARVTYRPDKPAIAQGLLATGLLALLFAFLLALLLERRKPV